MRRRIVLLAFLAGAAFAAPAAAHDRGYSTSELDVVADGSGTVEAHFVFAASDLEKVAGEDFVANGVELRADDVPCGATLDHFSPAGADGVDVGVRFSCSPHAHAFELTLYLLSDLAPAHRSVARISSGSRTTQAILSPKERVLRLELDDAPTPAMRQRPPLVLYGVAILVLVAAIVLVRRFATRNSTAK